MRTFLVTARAYITTPDDVEVLYSAMGDSIGLLLRDGTEARPLIALHVESDKSKIVANDREMNKLGMEVIHYLDDTGVEEE